MNKKKIALIIFGVIVVAMIIITSVYVFGDKDKIDCKYKYKIKEEENIVTVKLYKGDDVDCVWFIAYNDQNSYKVEKQTGEKYDIFTINFTELTSETVYFVLKREETVVYKISAKLEYFDEGKPTVTLTDCNTLVEDAQYQKDAKIPFKTVSATQNVMIITLKCESNKSYYVESDDGVSVAISDYSDDGIAYAVVAETSGEHQIKFSDDSEKVDTTLIVNIGSTEDNMLYVIDSQEVKFEPSEEYERVHAVYG